MGGSRRRVATAAGVIQAGEKTVECPQYTAIGRTDRQLPSEAEMQSRQRQAADDRRASVDDDELAVGGEIADVVATVAGDTDAGVAALREKVAHVRIRELGIDEINASPGAPEDFGQPIAGGVGRESEWM